MSTEIGTALVRVQVRGDEDVLRALAALRKRAGNVAEAMAAWLHAADQIIVTPDGETHTLTDGELLTTVAALEAYARHEPAETRHAVQALATRILRARTIYIQERPE